MHVNWYIAPMHSKFDDESEKVTSALPHLAAANYMPMENCTNLVDYCIRNIYACRDLALHEPDLRKVQRALEDLLFALLESLIDNQPALTATLLHSRLRASKGSKAQTMRSAVIQELKEIRQASRKAKTGFPTLAG